MKASRGFRCEVRTIWGHLQQFESIGICIMSLAQESEVRVPWVPGVGLCLRIRLGARCNRLKLVRQATEPGPTLCVVFIQGGR